MNKMNVMLAKELQKGITLNTDLGLNTPPEGWIWSEKYDGYRALFQYKDGRGIFMSRSGKEFGPAPQWFIDAMPPPKFLKDTKGCCLALLLLSQFLSERLHQDH